MRRRSDLAAYLAMRGAMAGISLLPRSAALAAGAAGGRMAWRLGLRRGVARQNLAAAFPSLGTAERRRLEHGVYEHFGRMTVDSLRLSARGPSALVPHVTGGECVALVSRALERGKGALVLTGHVGNWELGGAYLAATGFAVAAVVKPPSNPFLARHAGRVRERLGIESIALPEARAVVPQVLAANRPVALVADQGALRSNLWGRFFGRPTRTPVGPGLFAAQSGAPVIFGALVAVPGGRYELMAELLFEEVPRDTGDALQLVSDRFLERLEALVRRVPEQYLWTHRLWKWSQDPATPAPVAP